MRTILPALLAALVLLAPFRTLAQDEASAAPAPSAPAAAADAATALLDELSIDHNPADDARAAFQAILTAALPSVRFVSAEESSPDAEEPPSPPVTAEDLPANIGYIRVLSLATPENPDDAPDTLILATLADWTQRDFVGAVIDLRNLAGDASALRAVKTLAASLPLRTPDAAPYELSPLRQDLRGFQPATLDCSEEIDSSRALSDLIPLVILADSTTSGAAERLAALFQHSIRSALVLGTPTAGDPLLSAAFPCPPEIMPDTQVILPAATLSFPDGFVLRPDAPLDPDVLITQAALSEPLYEPDENSITFRSRKKGTLEEEAIDRALRDRVRDDPYLRRATDILLGLRALVR